MHKRCDSDYTLPQLTVIEGASAHKRYDSDYALPQLTVIEGASAHKRYDSDYALPQLTVIEGAPVSLRERAILSARLSGPVPKIPRSH